MVKPLKTNQYLQSWEQPVLSLQWWFWFIYLYDVFVFKKYIKFVILLGQWFLRQFPVSQNLVLIQTNFPIVQNIHRKTGSHQITNIISNIDFWLMWKTFQIPFLWYLFHAFPISMKKLKIDFFSKNVKKIEVVIFKKH